MDEFLEFIRQRRRELKRELEELDIAERLYLKSGAQMASVQKRFEFSGFFPGKEPKTIKEMVVVLLSESYPRGMTALEILEQINFRWNKNLERTSLSPQLSRLKGGGMIVSDKGTWKLATQETLSDNELE